MKRIPILFLAVMFILAACDQKGKVPQSQTDFLMRLKRSQDTATLFSHQKEIQMRIITNMSKYVASNLNFTGWSFKVEKVNGDMLDLKTPAPADTTGFNTKFVMLTSAADAKVKDALAKVKEGDVINVDGEIDMKTADGKISMTNYFTTDSAHYIKLLPKQVK